MDFFWEMLSLQETLFLLILLGILAKKLKIVNESGRKTLSDLLIYASFPATSWSRLREGSLCRTALRAPVFWPSAFPSGSRSFRFTEASWVVSPASGETEKRAVLRHDLLQLQFHRVAHCASDVWRSGRHLHLGLSDPAPLYHVDGRAFPVYERQQKRCFQKVDPSSLHCLGVCGLDPDGDTSLAPRLFVGGHRRYQRLHGAAFHDCHRHDPGGRTNSVDVFQIRAVVRLLAADPVPAAGLAGVETVCVGSHAGECLHSYDRNARRQHRLHPGGTNTAATLYLHLKSFLSPRCAQF